MKIAKVKITKERLNEGKETKFTYPAEYEVKVVRPFIYQNEGNGVELCLAHVPDDYVFSKDISEVNLQQGEALVRAWIASDKDLDEAKLAEQGSSKDDVISKKLNHLNG